MENDNAPSHSKAEKSPPQQKSSDECQNDTEPDKTCQEGEQNRHLSRDQPEEGTEQYPDCSPSNQSPESRVEVDEQDRADPSCAENSANKSKRTPIKRRRILELSDEEIDEEPEMMRRVKVSKIEEDLDFDVEEAKEIEEKDSEDSDMLGAYDEEAEEEFESMSIDEGCDNDDGIKKKHRTQGVTLSSYSREYVKEGFPLPRDAKRRKRFTQKIGRLEKNSFFIRRTGGGEQVPRDTARQASSVSKYTPLETQYLKMRKQNPDMLLVVECGYKYRLFDEDASAASKILRIAAYFDHNFLTAGFPTQRLAHHVGRLVHAGYKVGVVSQIETAALKKASDKASKLFERKLTAVYTKGTFLADGKMNALMLGTTGKNAVDAPTYIMAILEVPHLEDGVGRKSQLQKIAVAAVDSATGEVLFDMLEDDTLRSNLESRLVALEPVEVLMPDSPSSVETELVVRSFSDNSGVRLEKLDSSRFKANPALGELDGTVKEKFSKLQNGFDPVLVCLGALAGYLSQFGLQLSMSNAKEFKSFSSHRQLTLGVDVLRNFEVFGNSNDGGIKGSLVGLVNNTVTAFGSRQIRQWLSRPLVRPFDILERLDAVEFLRDVIDNRASAVKESEMPAKAVSDLVGHLSGLPDLEKGLTRILCRKCTPSEFLEVIRAFEGVGAGLDCIRILLDRCKLPPLLHKIFSNAPIVKETLSCNIVELLSRSAAASNTHYALFSQEATPDELRRIPRFRDFLELVSQLDTVNERVCEAEKAMDVLLKKLKKKHSFPTWQWKKVAVEEYLLEVPTARASSVPHTWAIVCQTKAVKRFRPPEASKGYDEILCSRETRDAISSKCWIAYLELFSSVATQLRAVVRTLANLDCLCALAHVSNLPGYTKPEIVNDSQTPAGLYALKARHPLTEALQSCHSYVPNDIRLGLGKHEIALVISGPNYGGKSSYTRMAALVAILAQTGSYVPAESAILSPFDSIYARMGSSDSIAKGMSSLMVELAETSRILRDANSRSLVVLDELGRGTSTYDGTAIAHATLGHLVRETKCVTMCVTHYPVLSSLQKEWPGYVSAHYMDYIEEKEDVNMDQNLISENSENGSVRNKRITFLYKLTKGVAPSSYGLNVARLAGIPSDVITHAAGKASALEAQLDKQNGKRAFVCLLRGNQWEKDEEVAKLLETSRASIQTFGINA